MPRHSTTLALVFGLIGTALPAFAQQQNAEQSVRDYVKTWQDTWNKKDAHGLAMLYTIDAIRIAPSGQVVSGRQNIEKDLAGGLALGDLSLNVGKIEGIRGDVAWGYNDWTIQGKDQNGAAQKVQGRSAVVWIHESDGWKASLEGAILRASTPETSSQ